MPFQRLLSENAFGPEEIVLLSTAYEGALRSLGLSNRTDPATEMVAKKIIQLAQQGIRDPDRLQQMAVQSLAS
jgi:hypothetical protein